MRAGTTLRDYGLWARATGAYSGIGEQFAPPLPAGGANLLPVARRADRLEHLGAELRQAHGIVASKLPGVMTPREVSRQALDRLESMVIALASAGNSVLGDRAR